jgi:precorrin-2 dehydrogenase/sirohydrochlorin ferrochelatase
VAARRVHALLAGEASVTVVAPETRADLSELGRAGKIEIVTQGYRSGVLKDAFLVVVATSDTQLNAEIASDARVAGCIVNDADEPERGDCIFPAVVKRGDLMISVTTGGASPSLTAAIRTSLEAQFGPEYEAYVGLLREAREQAMSRIHDSRRRKRALAALAADTEIFEMIRVGRPDDARARAFTCILSSPD